MIGASFHAIGLRAGYPTFTGLLNLYPGAAVAYSLRALSASFVNSDIVLVRRSSDNAELGFTATEITNGTLTTWTGANDGFVVTWYDQSGNSRDATQSTAGNQPKIVSAGVLVTSGSFPAISFLETHNLSATTSNFNQPSSVFLTSALKDLGGAQRKHFTYLDSDAPTNGIIIGNRSGKFFYHTGNNALSTINENVNMNLWSAIFNDGSGENGSSLYINGSDSGASGVTGSESGYNTIQIGDSELGTSLWREAVIYPTNQTSSRSGIDANIAEAWGITIP